MNGWKWATFGLAGLVVLQFWWWNKQAPQVLNLGSGRRPAPGPADQTQLGCLGCLGCGRWR